MKIAVIAHLHYPIKQPYTGGLEAHTDLLVRQLTARGHTVTLYAKAGSKTDGTVIPIFMGNAKDGKNRFLKVAYRYACARIAARAYDLIINNCLDSYPLEWHTADMPPMITIFHAPPFWELTDALKIQPFQENRTFIAVSEFTARQWQPFVAHTVHAVSNGIDMSQWTAHTEKPATQSALWLGRITPEKGTHVAIEAAAIAGIPLEICGKIYDKNYFHTTIEPLLKRGSVTYVGHLNQRALNQRYKRASVALVTPLWDEPFGLVAVEALASGVPVAALNHGATSGILTDACGVLAASDTPEDLANAITKALMLDRTACAEYAHTTYDVSMMVENYLALIPGQKFVEEAIAWQTYA